MDPREIVKKSNYMHAMNMLCVKVGKVDEYSWFFLRKDPELCKNGGRARWISKMTRLLALNYDGIHSGDSPALSPRLLPDSNPNSKPLRYPQNWNMEDHESTKI